MIWSVCESIGASERVLEHLEEFRSVWESIGAIGGVLESLERFGALGRVLERIETL